MMIKATTLMLVLYPAISKKILQGLIALIFRSTQISKANVRLIAWTPVIITLFTLRVLW